MPKVITVMEAAERLGVHHGTIRRWIREGRLRPYKQMGDTRRYVSVDEVEALREPQLLERRTMPSVAVAIVTDRAGRCLMTRRRFQEGTLHWSAPTGEVEPGETPEQAVVREVREELALKIAPIRRLGARVHPASGRHLVYIACRIVAGEAAIIDHEELAEIQWLTLPEVQERLAGLVGGLFEPVREYLKELVPAE